MECWIFYGMRGKRLFSSSMFKDLLNKFHHEWNCIIRKNLKHRLLFCFTGAALNEKNMFRLKNLFSSWKRSTVLQFLMKRIPTISGARAYLCTKVCKESYTHSYFCFICALRGNKEKNLKSTRVHSSVPNVACRQRVCSANTQEQPCFINFCW